MDFIIDLREAVVFAGPAEVLTAASTSITAFPDGPAMAAPTGPAMAAPTGPAMVAPTGLAMDAPTGLAMVATTIGQVEATTTITISDGITQPMATLGWQSVPMCTVCQQTACMRSIVA